MPQTCGREWNTDSKAMKQSISFLLFCSPLLFLLTACDPETTNLDMAGMFSGSSPRADQRFEDSQAYNTRHGIDTLSAQAECYRVYVCTDTHVDTSRRNYLAFLTDFHADEDAPLAVHLGDLINAQKHWQFFVETWQIAPRPAGKRDTMMVTLGNHDIYFGQWTEFKQYFHTSSYWFVVQTPSGAHDFYLVFDSAEGVLGEKQLAWLRSTLRWAKGQPFRHRIVCTHTHLFMQDYSQGHTSNYPLEETYELLDLFASNGIELHLSGHDHCREVTSLQGCTYIVVDALEDPAEDPAYLVATISDRITYDFVSVTR